MRRLANSMFALPYAFRAGEMMEPEIRLLDLGLLPLTRGALPDQSSTRAAVQKGRHSVENGR
jgi:hypothetical protein